ncbi:hypothetical protein SDC9_181463 [bioreactor metagenome]|uniref:Uncharacterized protein n=1 Tax=bioreactor metagenome TaxID=1076179 RepID=A0A645H4M4_9ZZZZ
MLFADGFGERGFAGKQCKFFAEDDVGLLRVFVVPNAVAVFHK